jgi:four helix bundle protein
MRLDEDKNKQRQEFKARIYRYILLLIKFLTNLPKDPIIKEITGQLMRSGTSIGANYFEAEEASSKKDYQNYFNHSLKSANESKFWLSVLIDSHLIPKEQWSECQWLLRETYELANIFASSILTMKGKKQSF